MPLQLWVLLLLSFSQANSQRASSQIASALAVKQRLLDDLIYSDFVLFNDDVISKVGCARACFSNHRCVLFTFTSLQPLGEKSVGRCVGHHSLVVIKGPNDYRSNTETFVFEEGTVRPETSSWLYQSCVTDDDCPTHMAQVQCYSEQCLCNPYSHYSVTQDACLDACLPEDLQRYFFLTYPVPNVQALSFVDVSNTGTLEDCLDVCSVAPYCTACEFDFQTDSCYTYDSPSCDCDPNYSVNMDTVSSFNRMACR